MTQQTLFNDIDSKNGLQARHCAAHLLNQILTRRTPMDQALDSDRELPLLDPRDRAFVRMVVATTLRKLGQIDDLIARASDRKEAPEPPMLQHLLRLGVTQILWMQVPDHATVNTSVDLCAKLNLSRAKGLVNAILRRVAREGPEWIINQDAARLNMPEWLIRTWVADYDLRLAAEIALASQNEAPLDITIKDPAHISHWASVLDAEILPTGSLRRQGGGNITELPGFDEGVWWVQDASAALPVTLMGNLHEKTALDLCAAPGGKTAQLAARGAQVHALDRAATRLVRLNDNLKRLALNDRVTVEAADAMQWTSRDRFDVVLLDAPCSATGTIRRHPDIPHLKTPDDIARLCITQTTMLDNAAALVNQNGMMVYCTCSLQKSEGEQQIDSFLTRHPDFTRSPIIASEAPGLEHAITPDGDLRILPQFWAEHGGLDGFYIARLTQR